MGISTLDSPRVESLYILDDLPLVRSPHFDVSSTRQDRTLPSFPSVPINLDVRDPGERTNSTVSEDSNSMISLWRFRARDEKGGSGRIGWVAFSADFLLRRKWSVSR